MLRRKWVSFVLCYAMLFTILGPINIGSLRVGSAVYAAGNDYSGDVLKLIVTNDGTTGSHYVYQQFSNSSYTFQAGDYIEYDVKIENNLSKIGGIDICVSDTEYFRDLSGWTDQNGITGHPVGDLSMFADNKWYHRKLAVPTSMIGRSSTKWLLAGENDINNLTYIALYDNIVVTDGNGTERKVVYKNSSDANVNTTSISNLISSVYMKNIILNSSEEDLGDVLRLIATNDGTSGNHFLYQQFSNTSYTFQSGDYIEYDVKTDNYILGTGGIDIYVSDTESFRDLTGWTDQNGINGHPAGDLSIYAYKSWYHRKLAVPASMIGRSSSKWLLAGENDTQNLTFVALYDNIVVTDGNGTERKVVYKNSSDANVNTTLINNGVSSLTMSTVSTVRLPSSFASSNDTTESKKYALDGDGDTSWFTTQASPNWLIIGLGETCNIKRWVVKHASSNGDLAVYNTKDFKLQISDDLITWTDVDTVTGNTAGITDRDVDATGRFVRLYITQGTQDGSDEYIRIREFEVYGNNALLSSFKDVKASASNYGGDPSGAVDRDISTTWFTIDASPNWLRVDLGKVCNINRWVVKHASSGGDLAVYNTKDFKLQISTDGTNFTDVDTVTGNAAGITDRNVNTTGRYVRLYITQGTQTGSDGYIRIREFEVYGKEADLVSLNKTATASSNDSGKLPGYSIDGNLASQWCSSGTGTQWLSIDLGQTYVINRWVVKHAGANWESIINNTKDFKLQVSNDGTNFTDVDTVTGNSERITDRNVAYATGRYVRLYITAGTQAGGDGKSRINEFQVYGTPTGSAPNPRVFTTSYSTSDIVVASYSVTDTPYSADNTGTTDATAAIQNALYDCSATGGGVVFMPVGKYRITNSISIPEHVTLRGDWQDPDVGTNYGTVLLADVPSSTNDVQGLIKMSGSSGLNGVTIYYPNQSATSPVAYPYTIDIPGRAYGEIGYMHQTVENVTLLNSYKGISVYKSNNNWFNSVGEECYIKNIKGTAMKQAMCVYNTADVGRIINVKFNNSYWAGAAAGYNPQSRSTLDTWTRANGTGFVVGDVEFDEFYNMSCQDYNVGMNFVLGPRGYIGSVTMFGIDIQNTNIALKVDTGVGNILGLQLSNSIFKANQGTNPVAVQVNNGNGAPITFNNCTIGGGATNAVQLANNSVANFFGCTFDDWSGTYAVTASAGSLEIEGCTFIPSLTSSKKGVSLSGSLISAALLGNTINGNSSYFLDNSSTGDVKRQDTGYTFETNGITGHTLITTLPKPPNNNFYNVKTSYGAKGDGVGNDTTAIQNALNAAGSSGGGTVYLPAGIYRIDTHLTVPANVELRGCEDVPHKGDAKGSILAAYEGRKTSTPDTDTAFITLNGANSGVRGLNIYYPEQPNSSDGSIAPFASYPWSIRGNASGVYAINVCFVNAYKGLDFGYGTNQCNNHYISYVNGTCLKNAIAVGNSTEGWLEDCMFNGTYWVRTTLPNQSAESTCFNYLLPYMKGGQTAFWIGNVQNEHGLNNFAYGTNKCYNYVVQGTSGPNARMINCSGDGSYSSIVIDGTGTTGVKIINGDVSVNDNGPAIHINGGTAKIFNISTAQISNNNQAIYITGGNSVLQGIYNNSGPCQVTAGSTKWNGVYINSSGDAGAQLTISAGVTGSNFSGCAGKDSVNFVNNAGAGATLSNNIKY
jgi:Endopolygalacturonase